LVIVIDSNEASTASKIYETLKSRTYVEVRPLPAGDYLIGDIIIERKTSLDLVNSLRGNRLWNELFKIKVASENIGFYSVLLLEGSPAIPVKRRGWNMSSVIGLIYSITFDWGIPIITTPSWKWTVEMLMYINSKRGEVADKKLMPAYTFKKGKDVNTVIRSVVEAIPGIGPAKAINLLNEFKTLKNIANASINDLSRVRKLTSKDVEIIYKVFNTEWSEDK